MVQSLIEAKSLAKSKVVPVKLAISAFVVALAVALPQIFHLIVGKPAGVKFLPMYIPVLIGGCLLGPAFGILVGLLSPITSFIITSLVSSPMPALERLPLMMVELSVLAFVSGLFSKKIVSNGLYAFIASISSFIACRAVYLGLVAIFGKYLNNNVGAAINQIKAGYPGAIVLVLAVPILILILKKIAGIGEVK